MLPRKEAMEPTQLHDDEFQRILWNESTQIIKLDWKESTERMTDDDMKRELDFFVVCVEKKRAPRILVDVQKFGYRMTPEVQKWWSENILTRYNAAGVKRFAFLFAPEIKITSAMNESAPGADFLTRSFNTRESAIKWLTA